MEARTTVRPSSLRPAIAVDQLSLTAPSWWHNRGVIEVFTGSGDCLGFLKTYSS